MQAVLLEILITGLIVLPAFVTLPYKTRVNNIDMDICKGELSVFYHAILSIYILAII